jgi:hypothetical protein
MHIQGYSLAGTGSVSAPRARQVTLAPQSGGCSDAYFAPAPGGGATSCSFQVNANLDLGLSGATAPAGVTVSAVVGSKAGTGGTSYPLTFSSSTGTTETWTGSASLPTGTGSNEIDLQVNCNKNAANSVCSGANTKATILNVQRAYAQSSSTSGPIQSAYIVDSAGNPDQDSFEVCETQDNNSCTKNLGVTITVSGAFANTATTGTTPYTLNYGSGTSASQTGSVTCPPNSAGQFVQTVTQGCQGTYICNGSVSAETNCVTDASCANINPLSGGSPPPPADCVQTNNGVSAGQIVQGFNSRIASPTNGSKYYCPNNWPTGGTFVSPPADDSRYVTMFIMPYGSFGGSGKTYYPIEGFAEFYVVGWDGDPCSTDPKAPDGSNGKGEVWGYFVQSITPNTTAIGGGKCTPSTFGPCVAILTN